MHVLKISICQPNWHAIPFIQGRCAWDFAAANYLEESFRKEARRKNEDRTFDLNFSTRHFLTAVAAQAANMLSSNVGALE
jgi:hypothetical protein